MFKKTLQLFTLTLLAAAATVRAESGFGRFHALVIGNQNYKNLKPLKTPIADAKAVAEVLEKQYGFTVEILLDATDKDILTAISKLRNTMTKEEDSLLVYYAGHGFLDKQSGVDYWQPVNAARDNDVDWVPTTRITDTLKAIQVRHVLIVADSCYAGSMLSQDRDSGAKLASGMEQDEWLRRVYQKRSRTALTSGGEEPVADGGGSGHSVFAKAFLDALRENKKILDGDGLFEKIKRPVTLNADQTPLYSDLRKSGHEMGGDFLLVPKDLQDDSLQGQLKRAVDLSFLQRGGDSTATPSVEETVAEQPPKQQPKQDDTMTDKTTGMEFVYVPSGCFQMGSPLNEKKRDEDEGPMHKVCVDGFWMGKTEVTQAQWMKIMDSNPSDFKGEKLPVEKVSWDNANGFIKKLNSKSGKQYRLPTEAEWEYAARAGTETVRYWDDSSDAACNYANVADQTAKKKYSSLTIHNCDDGYAETAPVGSFQPNSFGLYDMLGNVWEWCADWYGSGYYAASSKDNPTGLEKGSFRVIRGGSWGNSPGNVRAADRLRDSPVNCGHFLGFRLVLPGQQGR